MCVSVRDSHGNTLGVLTCLLPGKRLATDADDEGLLNGILKSSLFSIFFFNIAAAFHQSLIKEPSTLCNCYLLSIK